jgi:hypothetical protein
MNEDESTHPEPDLDQVIRDARDALHERYSLISTAHDDRLTDPQIQALLDGADPYIPHPTERGSRQHI